MPICNIYLTKTCYNNAKFLKGENMFERINQIIKNIENIQDEITIALNMAKISLEDYIMIKRGSLDIPEHLNMSLFAAVDEQVMALKKEIDVLNKLKKEWFVY